MSRGYALALLVVLLCATASGAGWDCSHPVLGTPGVVLTLTAPGQSAIYAGLDAGKYVLQVESTGRAFVTVHSDPCYMGKGKVLFEGNMTGTDKAKFKASGLIWVQVETDTWPVTIRLERG